LLFSDLGVGCSTGRIGEAMTTGASKVEPWEVPADYNVLYTQYGAFIGEIVRRYNKVGRNFRELFQQTWQRLVEAQMLDKFAKAVEYQDPKTMTAEVACAYLGIAWKPWTVKMHDFHRPKSAEGSYKKWKRDPHWMPIPLNEAEFIAAGKGRGLSSKKAVFAFEDIARIADHTSGNCGDEKPWFKSTGINRPEKKATQAHFKNYLSVMVRNTLANAFRTNSRKHKERAFDTFSEFRKPSDEGAQGFLPDPELVDPSMTGRTETLTALAQAKVTIRTTLADSIRDVPECRPVSEYETELFDRMEEGYTLKEAIGKLDVPTRAKERFSRVILKAFQG